MALDLVDIVPRLVGFEFTEPINISIKSGEHWAIIGPNGSGKTILSDIIAGKYALKQGAILYNKEPLASPSKIIKSISFRDIYSLADIQNSYYQQRWNKGDEQETTLVASIFNHGDDLEYLNQILDWFDIRDLLSKEINLLSSGELRKSLIVRTLLSKPQILIIDNPFIGLDEKSRHTLNEVLKRVSEFQGTQIILVLSDPHDIPPLITNILPLKNGKVYPPHSKNEFLEKKELFESLFLKQQSPTLRDIQALYPPKEGEFENALIMKQIQIKYGERTILKDLEWTVKRGEKWCLMGANGSGKSTLLSLILGDNPQAYANNITLFDRKRGTGESIWDIKKRIGYVSPEMHLFYLKNNKTIEIVGSGFFDTIGLYQKVDDAKQELALVWMRKFGIDHLSDRPFLKLSFGEQRLALLVRAFVKNPDLLILDEPLHGLDVSYKEKIIQIIEDFCDDSKTLIYVTHYRSEIPTVVSKFLHLEKQV